MTFFKASLTNGNLKTEIIHCDWWLTGNIVADKVEGVDRAAGEVAQAEGAHVVIHRSLLPTLRVPLAVEKVSWNTGRVIGGFENSAAKISEAKQIKPEKKTEIRETLPYSVYIVPQFDINFDRLYLRWETKFLRSVTGKSWIRQSFENNLFWYQYQWRSLQNTVNILV